MGIFPFPRNSGKTIKTIEVDLDKVLPEKIVPKKGGRSNEIDVDKLVAWAVGEFGKETR